MSILKTAILFIFVGFTCISAQWVQTNGPIFGYPSSFAISPDSSNICLGFRTGGIYFSTDQGSSWKKNDGGKYPDWTVPKILFRKKEILAATGFYIIRSTDNGQNWITIGNGITDPVVYDLALNGNDILAGTGKGLFISRDEGDTWTLLNSQIKGKVTALAIKDSIIYAASDGQIIFSQDNGTIWTNSFGIDSLSNITQILSDGRDLFALVNNFIYKSIDKGKSWFKSDSGINKNNDGLNSVNCLHRYKDLIYAGTSKGLYLSADNGESWSSLSSIDEQINTTAVFASGAYILAGTETRGMYRSIDNGKNWKLVNDGLINRTIGAVAGDDSCVFAGVERGFTYKSTDKGKSWSTLSLRTNSDPTSSILLIGKEIYVSWVTSNPYKSTDYGITWKPSYKGFPISLNIMQLIRDENNIYAATHQGVFYTPLHKDEWQHINNGLTSLLISSIVKDGDTFYVSTLDGEGIYRSTDYGQNWTPFNYGITNKRVLKMGAIGHKLFADVNYGGFCSFDGSVWSRIEYPYFSSVSCFYVKDNYLFMGTGNGLWVTSDYGLSWEQQNTGLIDKSIKTITVSGEDMYLGTARNGVFRRPLSELIKQQSDVEKQIPVNTFSLEQNYPNPFNPTTKIRYSIPQASGVSLKIYDLLGREVITLVNEFKNSGVYDVSFDGTDLPSGVYIYTLQACGLRESKKLLLLR